MGLHSQRSVLRYGIRQDIDTRPFKLNDIAKVAFSVAEVAFGVRVGYWCIRSRNNAGSFSS